MYKNINNFKVYKQPPSFKKDNEKGMKAEYNLIRFIKKNYGIELKQLNRYHFADFIHTSKKLIFELKRRNNNRKRYPCTIIGYDKVERFRKFNKENNGLYLFIMIFHFNDGIFYFIHNEKVIYDVRKYVRHKRIDYIDKPKDYIFIPIEQLQPISKLSELLSNNITVRHNV